METHTATETTTASAPGEGWEQRIADLEVRLREWRRRCSSELDRILRERKLRGWLRRPRQDELQSAMEEARRRAGVELLAELGALFDEICDRYVVSLPQERAKIRARVGAAEEVFDHFWGYVEAGPARIRGREDGSRLLRGLVAVAIDDMRAELGLVDRVLGELLAAAKAAEIEWRPILEKAAKLANPGAGGGGACMRSHLIGTEPEQSLYDSPGAGAPGES